MTVQSYAEMSRRLSKVWQQRGEWAGLPMPLPGLALVLEDRHPGAAMLAEAQRILDRDAPATPTALPLDPDLAGWREVNRWRGHTKDGITGHIVMLRHEDGRMTWGLDADSPKRNSMLFGPMSTFDAWHIETELTAIDKLATLLSERMFHAYVLTGSFLETSRRSGLTYLFRRCRPTIVLTPHHGGADGFRRDEGERGMRILACLCLHPIAFYRATFAGAMVPTDDVIAHLLLMRGAEALFWRRANQHHPLEPESGL